VLVCGILYNKGMKYSRLVQLETNLERLVEGAFAQLFGANLQAHDVGIALGRALEQQLRRKSGETKPIAPDTYLIYLSPNTITQLAQSSEETEVRFKGYIVDLVKESGYHLLADPTVNIIADDNIKRGKVRVITKHQHFTNEKTAAMEPIFTPENTKQTYKAQLIINNERTINLTATLYRIGRAPDNDIVIDDKYTSRHHLQLRLRQGAYTLFDIQSRAGTQVNKMAVREHRLQTGDVIHIGQTTLLFMSEETPQNPPPHTTDGIPPVEM